MTSPHGAAGHTHDAACEAAHGTVRLPADTRGLVVVFDSPVAREIQLLATRLGWPVRLHDAGELGPLGPDVDVVVCDHDRPELGDVLAQVLAQPTRWVGVMGSLRHTAPHLATLRERGLSEEDIARVHRPIGLDIGSHTPLEIAISTVAGLIADRNDRPGGVRWPPLCGHLLARSRVRGVTYRGGRVEYVEQTDQFEAERPRLVGIASRVLGDHAEAQDIVQQAWLRLHGTDAEIANLPAWLTTVTTRLCLDRLRSRTPVPVAAVDVEETAQDPADDVALADTVGLALNVVLDRLSPRERVAFVLHDSFGFEFATIASLLDTTPSAARKLASRARAKVAQPPPEDALADWEIVDAFMAAAKNGDFNRLLRLLAPDAAVTADEAAALAGTPRQIEGRDKVATFFNGSAAAALPVFVGDRPGAAWYHLGAAKVVFDFSVRDGLVHAITFRAATDVLSRVVRRDGGRPRG